LKYNFEMYDIYQENQIFVWKYEDGFLFKGEFNQIKFKFLN